LIRVAAGATSSPATWAEWLPWCGSKLCVVHSTHLECSASHISGLGLSTFAFGL